MVPEIHRVFWQQLASRVTSLHRVTPPHLTTARTIYIALRTIYIASGTIYTSKTIFIAPRTIYIAPRTIKGIQEHITAAGETVCLKFRRPTC